MEREDLDNSIERCLLAFQALSAELTVMKHENIVLMEIVNQILYEVERFIRQTEDEKRNLEKNIDPKLVSIDALADYVRQLTDLKEARPFISMLEHVYRQSPCHVTDVIDGLPEYFKLKEATKYIMAQKLIVNGDYNEISPGARLASISLPEGVSPGQIQTILLEQEKADR